MEQGTIEWYEARCGKLTASNFSCVLAGAETKKRKAYLDSIINEIRDGPVLPEEEDPWFKHGKMLEPYALEKYIDKTRHNVDSIGLVIHPEYDFISCSPDGIMSHISKGLEIKSRVSWKMHEKCINKGMPSENKAQVQGCLWVTGYESWDYVSYYQNLAIEDDWDLYVQTVLPDLEYHKRLEAACLKFWDEIRCAIGGVKL